MILAYNLEGGQKNEILPIPIFFFPSPQRWSTFLGRVWGEEEEEEEDAQVIFLALREGCLALPTSMTSPGEPLVPCSWGLMCDLVVPQHV